MTVSRTRRLADDIVHELIPDLRGSQRACAERLVELRLQDGIRNIVARRDGEYFRDNKLE